MRKVLVDEAEYLLCRVIQFFVSRRVDARLVRLLGMHGETAFRLAVNVYLETELLALRRNLETRKCLPKSGSQLGLNLLLQFRARRGLKRRHGGIGRASDESTLGLR